MQMVGAVQVRLPSHVGAEVCTTVELPYPFLMKPHPTMPELSLTRVVQRRVLEE